MKQIRTFKNLFALALTCSFLTGCATVKSPTPSPQTLVERNKALTAIQSFDARGALAIRTAKEADSVRWQWEQRGKRYTLTLRGPLGVGTVRLRGAPGQVFLDRSDGKTVQAQSPDQLLAQETGWKLPVSGLHDWIRGLAVPGVPAQKTYDTDHRLRCLKQQGWTIQYLHYTKVEGVDLPDQMTLSARGIFLKVVIKDWHY